MPPRNQTGGASAPSDPTQNGGVTARTVHVETPDVQTPKGIAVVTTDVGAGPKGLIPVGTEMTVSFEAYSGRWMRPKDEAAAKALAKLKK